MSQYVHIPTIQEYQTGKQFADLYFILDLLPKETFLDKKVNINELTYSEVKSVIRYLSKISGLSLIKSIKLGKDVFETCYKVDSLAFDNALITDYIQALKYLDVFFKSIIEKEQKLLSSYSEDTVKWMNAGGDRLDKHSELLPLVQLGKIFGQYPFELGDKRYVEILKLTRIEMDLRQVENKMSKAS